MSAEIATRFECSSGLCPKGCSHLYWKCDVCHVEGGWGVPREKLEKYIKDGACSCSIQMTPLETHAKNLAWIDEEIEYMERGREFMLIAPFIRKGIPPLTANRKVLERHGPDKYGDCRSCINWFDNGTPVICGITYPCPTTTDISEGLGIEG